ncbi:hypothetical protein V6N13_134628 [Hibiscus sabdariffa]
MRKVKAASDELKDLLKAEELLFRQKSRVQYVKEGDQSFVFFFRQVAARNKANTIRVLLDGQGNKLEQFDDIPREFIQFFSNSLGIVDHNVTEVSDALLKDILGVGLTEGMCEGLIASVLGGR